METTAKKRVLVLCGGKFAAPALQKLAYENFLCGIGIGKGQQSVVDALEKASTDGKLPFRHFPDKQSTEELASWIREINPDFVFSISFPFLLGEDVLSFGEKKFINLHPGPLPQYRGPMPIFEVLRYQEEQTAIAVHYMNADFDEGALIFNDYLNINPDDTFGKLADRLSHKAAHVAFNLANMLEYATMIPANEQDENDARYFEFPEEVDTTVNWRNMSSDMIVALANACNPWNGGVSCMLDGMSVKIVSASVCEDVHQSVPGTVLSYNDNGKIKVACSDNTTLNIDQVNCDWGHISSERYARYLKD